MKQNKLLKALLVVCSLAALSCAATGCDLFVSNNASDSSQSSDVPNIPEENIYEFEGLQDVNLSLSATSYDFTAGVKAYKNLEETTFNVDASAVVFGTAGQYTVKYTVDDHEETITVYVYGNPTFTETNATITYQDAQNAVTLKKAVTAKDYFGKDLSVTVVEGISANAYGYIEYGTHSVKFSATDAVGNTAEYTCNVVVSDADKPALADISIDLVDIEEVTVYEGVQLSKIIMDGAELTSNDYSYANGYLTFSEDFIMGKDLGNYTLLVVTSAGYDEITLSITDAEDAKYSLNVSDMSYETTLSFKKAVLTSNQQNITFEYALKNSAGEAVAMTDDGDTFKFVPGMETFFTLTVSAKRGTESAGVKDYPFTVQDDVYMWMVNRNNDKDAMNFVLDDAGYDYGYTTEQSFNGLGALKAEALSSGHLQILLKNVANLPVQSTVYFYVYNPTGIALQAYFFNNSGYWANMGLSVCSNMADISANAGWQKVSLTLSPGFDGTFGSMSTFEPTTSQAELRIVNPDGWKWEGEGKFGVYMSNIYVEATHGMNGVSYDESNHQSTGVATLPVGLATASSTDNRHTFKYEMKKGSEVVKSASEPFAFTPDAEGEYTYTITTYWRGEVVGTKDYTISVSGAFALSTAVYYQYDGNGYVTLPAASCAISGATVVYTVTNPAGETTELLSDMTYATNGVAGTYVYTAKAMVNGEVVDSATKNILIHSANVLLGSGLSADNVNNAALSFGNPVFSYTTEEAAPGELGAMKLDNSANGEPGNFNIRLESTAIASKGWITFYIKNPSQTTLGLQMYSASTWLYGNYWYNGKKYEQNATGVMDYVIEPSNEWQRIDAYCCRPDGAAISGSDIRVQFCSSLAGYGWDSESQPIIYISNIYYELPIPPAVEEPVDPEIPELPENLLVANGVSADYFTGNKLKTLYCDVEYTDEDSAPGENGCAKLSAVPLTATENYLAFNIESYDLAGVSKIVFPIKYQLGVNAFFAVYSPNTSNYVNMACGDKTATVWEAGCEIIESSDEWQWVTVYLNRPADGVAAGGGEIRISLMVAGPAVMPADASILIGNIYTEKPATEPEAPAIPENALVLNGCGEANFNGSGLNGVLGLTATYCADESAPGETGCAKLDNSAWSEKGNFVLTLNTYDLSGKSMITFYIKSTSALAMQCKVYSTGTGNYINYWVNNELYCEDWTSLPITADNEWVKVEVLLTNHVGTPVSGDVWLFFVTENYAWDEGEAPVIYMSNIYYS